MMAKSWHTHPLGQTLNRDGWLRPRETLGRPDRGDSAGGRGLDPPAEKHWHGASPTTAIAIQEHLDGKTADWMEKVTDEQYQD